MLFGSTMAYANGFSMTLIIEQVEHSKDSYSSEEVMKIEQDVLNYSIKHFGKRSPLDLDYEKKCSLSEENETTIKNFLKDNSLNVNDSIIDKSNSIGNYVNISVGMWLDGVNSNLLMQGEINNIAETIYYYRIIKLYNLLKEYINDC